MVVINQLHGYFADRYFNILGIASTTLPECLHLYSDIETEEIEAGVSTFEASLSYKKKNNEEQYNTSFVKVGNFFLFQDEDGKCKWYTILKTKKDRKKKSIWFYAEDAGLDLLNEIVVAYTADKAYPISYYVDKFSYDSGFEIGLNELGDSLQRKLEWEGAVTATERLLSVCTQFDNAELSFSYEVSNNRISKKFINIHKKRGAQTDIKLSLDRDVDNIITTESILNLRTGLRATGGTPEGSDSPITLQGYNYDDGTFFVNGDKLLNREANKLWTRYLTETGNDNGYIVGTFDYDTLSQSELCNRAVTALKTASEIEQNFEVDVAKLPDSIRIGDTVYIVDADDDLYLQARILKLEKSRCSNKATATLGDYLIKSSGISAKLQSMADQIKRGIKQAEIIASNGTKVNTGTDEPTTKRVNDIWFRENADGTVDTVKWNGTAWATVANDIESKKIAEQAESALTAVAEAKIAAQEAFDKGVEALRVGTEAGIAANNAQTLGTEAKTAATDAKIAADQAVEAAQDAGTEAANAVTAGNEAKTLAQDAQTNANNAIAAANSASSTATSASSVANTANTNANTAVNNAQTALTNAGTALTNAQAALNEANLAKAQSQQAIDKYMDMGMYPAWKMADGTFTKTYPSENLISYGYGYNQKLRVTKTNGYYYYFDVGMVPLKPNTTYIFEWDYEQISGAAQYLSLGYGNGNTFLADMSGGSVTLTPKFIVATTGATIPYPYLAIRLSRSATPTSAVIDYFNMTFREDSNRNIFTRNPSEAASQDDYIPKYVGFCKEPSDNPDDYTWILNPDNVNGGVEIAITNINGELSQKVSQTTFDTLQGTVTAQGTQINQNKADITLKASQSTVDTLTGRVTTTEGSISTIAGQVALKANQTTVDTLSGKVTATESTLSTQAGQITALNTKTDGHTTQIGSLQSSYAGLSSTVSTVQNNLNNLSIGGRNYALTTDQSKTLTATGTGQATISRLYDLSDKLIGKQVTISFDIVKSEGTTGNNVFIAFAGTGQQAINVLISDIPVGTPIRLTRTFTVSSTENTGYLYMQTYNTAPFLNGSVTVSNLKLEIGNKVTDHSPAPEDQATVVQMSNLTQTVDTFKTEVTNNQTQTSSQLTQLSDRMNFTVNNSDGSVTQIDLANKVISLSGNQINITGNTFISAGVIKTANIADAAITNAKVADLAVGTAKIANAAITNAKIGSLAVGTAQIADAAITNAKIGSLAVGTANIANAAITDAKIANISASKIVTGTLDAGVVNVLNLNADNLKSGTINALDIVGSSFTNSFDREWVSGSGIKYKGSTTLSSGILRNSFIAYNSAQTLSNGWITVDEQGIQLSKFLGSGQSEVEGIVQLSPTSLFLRSGSDYGSLTAQMLTNVPWSDVPLAAGYETKENASVQYRKTRNVDGSYKVEIRGRCGPTGSGTFALATGTKIGTLPVGNRPTRLAMFACAFSGGYTGRVQVELNGDIYIQVNQSDRTTVMLDGIVLPMD